MEEPCVTAPQRLRARSLAAIDATGVVRWRSGSDPPDAARGRRVTVSAARRASAWRCATCPTDDVAAEAFPGWSRPAVALVRRWREARTTVTEPSRSLVRSRVASDRLEKSPMRPTYRPAMGLRAVASEAAARRRLHAPRERTWRVATKSPRPSISERYANRQTLSMDPMLALARVASGGLESGAIRETSSANRSFALTEREAAPPRTHRGPTPTDSCRSSPSCSARARTSTGTWNDTRGE